MNNTKPKYPNSECGDCSIRLAIGGVNGITIREATETYCHKCRVYYGEALPDCDGRCLICDYYHPAKGCSKEDSKDEA